jgi:hypothetical protein
LHSAEPVPADRNQIRPLTSADITEVGYGGGYAHAAAGCTDPECCIDHRQPKASQRFVSSEVDRIVQTNSDMFAPTGNEKPYGSSNSYAPGTMAPGSRRY